MDIDLQKFLKILLSRINITLSGMAYIIKTDGTIVATSEKEDLFYDKEGDFHVKTVWDSNNKALKAIERRLI